MTGNEGMDVLEGRTMGLTASERKSQASTHASWPRSAHVLMYNGRTYLSLQVEVLRRLRQDSQNMRLRDALLVSINGIAAGMRNTG